jgi:hypothetical protein
VVREMRKSQGLSGIARNGTFVFSRNRTSCFCLQENLILVSGENGAEVTANDVAKAIYVLLPAHPGVILGPFDISADIGAPAEKEAISVRHGLR